MIARTLKDCTKDIAATCRNHFAVANRTRIASLRCAAHEKKASIRQNPRLSDAQRKVALELLRQQTEDEMRRAVGEREFHAFKAFHQWWFRELCVAA